jgi:hypothetical protein
MIIQYVSNELGMNLNFQTHFMCILYCWILLTTNALSYFHHHVFYNFIFDNDFANIEVDSMSL